MPIEAQVNPLPRELTTPPVTKMCLAIPGKSSAGGEWGHSTKRSGGAASRLGGVAPASLAVEADEAVIILAGIDAEAGVRDQPNLEVAAQGKHSQLFQFFQLLERFGRRGSQFHQEIAPVSV